MRRDGSISKSVRLSERLEERSRMVAAGKRSVRRADGVDDFPLTPAQVRELKRRVADLDDPLRYVLASRMTPRFVLYYNVSDDTYALNDPKGATLFKRRSVAEGVKRLLGGRVRVFACTTRKRNGQRVPLLPVLARTSRHR